MSHEGIEGLWQGKLDTGAISTLDLRGYVAAMHEANYAKSTIARRLASLRTFFRFGQREGWIKGNPAKPLRNPRPDRKLPHFLSTDEVGRLLVAPPATTDVEMPDGGGTCRSRTVLSAAFYRRRAGWRERWPSTRPISGSCRS